MSDDAEVSQGWDPRFKEALFDGDHFRNFVMEWPELQPVADNFFTNFGRAHLLLGLVADVSVLSSLVQLSVHDARAEFGLNRLGPLSPEKDEKVRKRAEEIYNGKIANHDEMWQTLHRNLGSLVHAFKMDSQLEVLFSGVVINAWTAFEMAATDLWVEAVNLRPKPLAMGAIEWKYKADDKGDALDQKGASGEKGPVLTFIQNLVESDEPVLAGSMLRRTGRFDFARFATAKAAYRNAFGIKPEFFKQDPFLYLEVLDAVRNALVHRAGRVDRMFLSRVKGSLTKPSHPEDPEASKFVELGLGAVKLNEVIRVDGVMVHTFIQAVYDATFSLMNAVDEWYKKNPE